MTSEIGSIMTVWRRLLKTFTSDYKRVIGDCKSMIAWSIVLYRIVIKMETTRLRFLRYDHVHKNIDCRSVSFKSMWAKYIRCIKKLWTKLLKKNVYLFLKIWNANIRWEELSWKRQSGMRFSDTWTNVIWITHLSQMETLNQTPSQIDLLTKTKLMQ